MKGSRKKGVLPNENPIEVRKKIAKKLKAKRKELGYGNGDDFAYDSGINRSQYGKYEAGSQDMRLSRLIRTINALGYTLEEFFSEGL